MLDISSLNDAQREAVTAPEGPMLVIAGAGSGKTRTIVYRLAWLAEHGLDPHSMLLLTFTRKASQEMLQRAAQLLGSQLLGVQGGTFHSFAFSVLRRWTPEWTQGSLSVMDTADSRAVLSECKKNLKIANGDTKFPSSSAILGFLSKAKNKEINLGDILSSHLKPYTDEILSLENAYTNYKRQYSLLDYDDLLFELEDLLLKHPEITETLRLRYHQILVDEYQDTNKVQARILRLLTGENGNIMAVGDDAQSIYAFRGATVKNIIEFPNLFNNTKIIRLEENYRSTQPILDIANIILKNSTEGYEKHLYSNIKFTDDTSVTLYRPLNDQSQSIIIAKKIEEYLYTTSPSEIAVLFRSGMHSFKLEKELTLRGIKFKKYGGMKLLESAHIKDVIAFAKLIANPLDLPSFTRVTNLFKGIGPKTSQKFFDAICSGEEEKIKKLCKKYDGLLETFSFIAELRSVHKHPDEIMNRIVEHYSHKMEELFPDDWPRRLEELNELPILASDYENLEIFISEVTLGNTEDSHEEGLDDYITLSTIHSAKGMEWKCVSILDLVEDRFPSFHSKTNSYDFEEERRLMYVACTRAKRILDLYAPCSIYDIKTKGYYPVSPSPFIRELPSDKLEEIYENYGGVLARRKVQSASAFSGMRNAFGASGESFAGGSGFGGPSFQPRKKEYHWDSGDDESRERRSFRRQDDDWPPRDRSEDEPRSHSYDEPRSRAQRENADDAYLAAVRSALKAGKTVEDQPDAAPKTDYKKLGFCRHRIFGRGKIVEEVEPGKYRVNFPGLGLKVILADYLTLE